MAYPVYQERAEMKRIMIAALMDVVSRGYDNDQGSNTYGTMPKVATAEGSDRIPTETFSAIMTVK
jgi:hypothetical protein